MTKPATVNIIFSIKYAPWVCAYPNGFASHTVKSANVHPNELFPPDPTLKNFCCCNRVKLFQVDSKSDNFKQFMFISKY